MQLEDALQYLISVVEPVGEHKDELVARDLAAADADDHRWREFALYAADVAELRVAASRKNQDHFREVSNVRVQLATSERENFSAMSPGARPVRLEMQVGALLGLRSHLLVDVVVAARELASWSFAIPERSVTFFDERLAVPEVLVPVVQMGGDRHFIAPAVERAKLRTVKSLDARNSDSLVEIRVPFALRRPGHGPYIVARAIDYHRHGYPSQSLITSLVDPIEWPMHAIVALHSERWVAMFGARRGGKRKRVPIAGDDPEAVYQRLWAFLRAHDLIRQALLACAEGLGVEPGQLSFVRAVDILGADALSRAMAKQSAVALIAALRPVAADLITEPEPGPVQINVIPQ